jgi:predicted lipid carrier protein YhbT
MRPKFLGSFPMVLPSPPTWLFQPVMAPLSALLTASVRRLAAERPEVFRRLGRFQQAAFLICPTDLPFAFKLTPRTQQGAIEVVGAADREAYSVRISGTFMTLLGLFDGTIDADSSFFAGHIKMDGATDAALALHNALEAAELGPGDILGLPSPLKPVFDKLFAGLYTRARHGVA